MVLEIEEIRKLGGKHLHKHSLDLYKLIKSLPDNSTALEIGVGTKGQSTRIILKALKGHLYSIDGGKGRVFERNHSFLNWTFLYGYDLDILENWNEKLDLVFIDLDEDSDSIHFLTLFNLLNEFIKDNGYIIVYNTNVFKEQIMPAILSFLDLNKYYTFENIDSKHGMGVMCKHGTSL